MGDGEVMEWPSDGGGEEGRKEGDMAAAAAMVHSVVPEQLRIGRRNCISSMLHRSALTDRK